VYIPSNILLSALFFPSPSASLYFRITGLQVYSTGNRGKDVLDGEEQTKTI